MVVVAALGLSDRGRPRKYTTLKVDQIDKGDLNLLHRFISDRGKTRSRGSPGSHASTRSSLPWR